MHDCFGKPIKPFDRVRAATAEELLAAGHPEASYPTVLSPAEKTALPGSHATDTCNVLLVDEVTFITVGYQTADGQVELRAHAKPYPQYATARSLVVL